MKAELKITKDNTDDCNSRHWWRKRLTNKNLHEVLARFDFVEWDGAVPDGNDGGNEKRWIFYGWIGNGKTRDIVLLSLVSFGGTWGVKKWFTSSQEYSDKVWDICRDLEGNSSYALLQRQINKFIKTDNEQ